MRKKETFTVPNSSQFKANAMHWAQQFNEVVWLDGNHHQQRYSSFDALLAVDALTCIETDYNNAFNDLKEYQQYTQDWIFGYLSYDLKNDVERLTSKNDDGLGFADIFFFQPKKIMVLRGDQLEVLYLPMVDDELQEDVRTLLKDDVNSQEAETHHPIKIKLKIFKDDYFDRVQKMLAHIHRGDIYEANFCQEFYAEDTVIDPLSIYKKLNSISRPPYSCFLKNYDKYALCSSPERYIKREGDTIISQPIKGTAKRAKDKAEDKGLKEQLEHDVKERSENIMIVDLVRNDLSKSAIKGSVEVEELCKVYSFDQVHQMISTVKATVPKDKNSVDLIKETFPMGSMTGAPKISAMKIIEELEATKRGLYSGAIGYFSPDGDFDFNVVIRSILYNETNKYVSCSVGSAITAMASPEKEYEECLVKAKAMREVLEGNT